MLPPEIVRTRHWIVASAALLAVAVPVLAWLVGGDRDWVPLAIGGGAIALLLVAAIVEGASTRFRPRRSNEAGYRLAYGRFVGLPLSSPGLGVFAQVTIFIMIAASFVGSSGELTPILAVGVLSLMAAIVLARQAWRGTTLELSQQGIVSRRGFGRQLIPWEALAPGGPLRPSLVEFRLGLIVSWPEQVIRSGLAFWQGTRERPFLLLNTMVHPWFLADSIAWYVANPAERAAIGTQEGHARLCAALSADVPFIPIEPPLEPPTRT